MDKTVVELKLNKNVLYTELVRHNKEYSSTCVSYP